jgi:hypothetical protein
MFEETYFTLYYECFLLIVVMAITTRSCAFCTKKLIQLYCVRKLRFR